MADHLLILGASARAAAMSARRAGYQLSAADLFADADLSEICAAEKVVNYPAGLVKTACAAPAGPWMYVGALENAPKLVDRIAKRRKLLGNSGDVLRRVRNPELVESALRMNGLRSLKTSHAAPNADREMWLQKPLRSAGGARIVRANSGATRKDAVYYQQFVEGTPCSAVYVAARGRSVLLGVTRQLIGTRWLGADGFRYAGSVGPMTLDLVQTATFQQIGNCLSDQFQLVGLFGVDAVVNSSGIWPVEVNPRYTASIEVLERSLEINAVETHARACELGSLPNVKSGASTFWGKGIVFATDDMVVPHHFSEFVNGANESANGPTIADIPHTNSRINCGQPITTVFAKGESSEEVLQQMKRLCATVNRVLYEPSP